jgi:hypothetical protein
MGFDRLFDEVDGAIIAHDDETPLIGCLDLGLLVCLVSDSVYIHQESPNFIAITIIGVAIYFFNAFPIAPGINQLCENMLPVQALRTIEGR